jgi:ABC-type multidrug transport system permease subunit
VRVLLVARKYLIEISRELQLLLLELATPLVFLGIAAAMYNAPLLATHPVLVSSPDLQGAPLVEVLEAERYADGRPVLAVTPTSDLEAAELALKEREATVLVILDSGEGTADRRPSTADDGRQSADRPTSEPRPLRTEVTIRGDPLYPRFFRVGTILASIVNRYGDRVAGRAEVVQVVARPLASGQPKTEFDLYAPGMMIVALLMLIPQTAMLVAREVRWHTLRRLSLTRLGAWGFFGGVSVAQLVFAVVQVVVTFLAALALGFNNQGSLALAVLVGIVVSFSAIGQGLLVACFVENDSQAANLGSTLTMLQVFVSGAFYQLPPLTLFTLARHQIDLFDVFPATHGFMALQQVLTYGAGLTEIGFRLGAMMVLSTLYFAAGVYIFQRLHMRSRN